MAEATVAQPVVEAAAMSGDGCVEHGEHVVLGKRPHPGDSPRPQPFKQRPPKKKIRSRKHKKPAGTTEGSAEEVLLADVQSLLARLSVGEEAEKEAEEAEDLPEKGTELELEVVDLSSTGDGLAVDKKGNPQKPRVYVVSFAVPGDVIRTRVYRHLPAEEEGAVAYSVADLVEIVRPSPELRDGLPAESARVQCQYFGRCSGCQYQMLDYGEQLRVKRRVVERAYRHFSGLPAHEVPAVLDTEGSPLQYAYRTKLTPHFDGPAGFRRRNREGRTLTEMPPIGFMQKGGGPRTILDIEQCPIGTPAVAAGMARERARVAREFGTYARGATLLLRESTERVRREEAKDLAEDPDAVVVPGDGFTDVKTCMTDNKATSTEYVGDYVFTNPAGSFFQNNNSILPALTAYVRRSVLPPGLNSEGQDSQGQNPGKLRYLIDAYSGSGLFTITLASTLPGGSVGIDIAEQSIAYARKNAELNHLPADRCRFLAADAAQLFAGVATVTTDPDETVVVLDPPRKGCDALFLRQLLAYAPARVVYVSCNVHTQARDVGMLVRGCVDGDGPSGTRYAIESLRGFDFFPQTAHVEGIAVLNRVAKKDEK